MANHRGFKPVYRADNRGKAASRSKPIGMGASSGKYAIRITITTASDCATAMCCSFAWRGCREISHRGYKGGMAGTEHNGEMYADYLVEMTTAGKNRLGVADLGAPRSGDRLHHRGARAARRMDPWKWVGGTAQWRHRRQLSNDLDGHRHRPEDRQDQLEARSAAFSWPTRTDAAAERQPFTFRQRSAPLDHPMPFSRVIEVELSTKQIVWKYQEKRVSDFFSPRISNAQRLA